MTILGVVAVSWSERARTCCKYSCDNPALPCPAWCSSQDDCVLRNASGLIEERVEGCRVRLDSKKQKTESSIENCLQATFNGSERLGSEDTFLPFYVVIYPFIGINQFNSHFRKELD